MIIYVNIAMEIYSHKMFYAYFCMDIPLYKEHLSVCMTSGAHHSWGSHNSCLGNVLVLTAAQRWISQVLLSCK